MKRKYKDGCETYKTDLKDSNKYYQELYSKFSKNMRQNLIDFLFYICADYGEKKEAYSDGSNNKSASITQQEFLCYIMLLNMFDFNKNFIKNVKDQRWELLEQYERDLIIIITFYLLHGDERYYDIINKIEYTLELQVFNKFNLIRDKINYLDEKNRAICLKEFLNKLNKFEEKHLKFDLNNVRNEIMISAIEERLKEKNKV